MQAEKNFVAMDFEYLYLAKYDTPCAVGLVKVVDNVVIEKYYSLIYQPEQNATLAPNNGITPAMLANAPHYEEVYRRMVEFVGNYPIVVHNAGTEKKVLEETTYPMEMKCLAHSQFIDTDHLSGHRSLQVLCDEYNIPLNHHNALSDAEACAEVYLRLCGEEKVQEVVREVSHQRDYKKLATADSKEADSYGSLPEEEWVCSDSPLRGKHVCVSGEYQFYPERADLRRALMKRGAIVDKAVLKNTEILVSGSIKPAGPSKAKQIIERGGKLMTESEAIALLQGKH